MVESPPRRGVGVARADERGTDSESLEAPPHRWTGREEGRVAKQFPVAPVAATGRKGGPVPGEEPRGQRRTMCRRVGVLSVACGPPGSWTLRGRSCGTERASRRRRVAEQIGG